MFLNQLMIPPFIKGQSVIFFGGDVNLGRRTNWTPHEKPFGDLQIMREADLRIINLECVVAAQGSQGINKGEGGPYYYHARPEQINLLTEAKIDVALTANNHAMDYYGEALFEQNNYLDRAGILHLGTGKNFDEASRPLFIKVNKLVIALFNVDATMKPFAATKNATGTFYLPPDRPDLWEKFFTEKIANARRFADVVIVAPHWGPNGVEEPTEPVKILGKLLIDCGADVVLGCHAHLLQGVENYKERPIIYDTGDFLFDATERRGGAFSIVISERGVEQVFFAPLSIGHCKISPANAEQSDRIGTKFIELCRKLNTKATVINGGFVELKFNPPKRAKRDLEPVELSSSRRDGEKIQPMTDPLPQWTPAQVPDDARIEPKKFGALKLVGCRIPSECLLMKKRQMLYIETWWTIDEPLEKDLKIRLLGVPAIKDAMPNFGAGMEHQGCDWLWPTNRWKQGVIYYERFGLRPPSIRDIVNVDIRPYISVLDGKTTLGRYFYPTAIKIQIPNRPTPAIKNAAPSEAISAIEKNVNIATFKREFAANNGVIFFMLRDIKPKAAGIEHSAFRRANLFKNYFGIQVIFLTNQYQNDLLEQCDDYGLDARVLNVYDSFQEIDRDTEKPREINFDPLPEDWRLEQRERDQLVYNSDGSLEMYRVFALKNQKLSYINFFDENHKKYRRDTYDELGFLSRRQYLDPMTGNPKEVFYYRPDGTLVIRELYEVINDKNTLTLIELINRQGIVTKTFTQIEDALAYWVLQLLNDETKNYFCIGDRTPEWHKAYAAIKSAELDNVRVIHQIHNIHVRAPFDPFLSQLKPRYKYFYDTGIKSDIIITLTNQQYADIIERYKLNNVVVLPHSVVSVPRVTDVKLDPFKIIQVGRIVEEKGHAKSVEMMRRVLEKVPQATLHFFGKGSLQASVQALIDKYNLGNNIKFEGFSNNMPAEFASSALSILPSTFEGSPLVVQESLQQACPVVAFDCCYGPRDSIVDDFNGYLVPVDDIESMAGRVIRILTEPGLREKLSANCARSIEKYSPDVVADKWAELFINLMQNSKEE